jgi:chaperone modulatory protein CbpM
MQATEPDWHWLDAGRPISAAELAPLCGLSEAELDELVDYGSLAPWEQAPQRAFSAACLPSLREAARLGLRFDLDLFTVGLLFGYLERIVELEHQLQAARAHATHTLPPREA